MTKLLGVLTEKYERKHFTQKYFTTSHEKGVVDGVGGDTKRLVCQKLNTAKCTYCILAKILLTQQDRFHRAQIYSTLKKKALKKE